MTPWERYQADLLRADFSEDPVQSIAVQHTQALYDSLLSKQAHENGLITVIKNTLGNKPKPKPMVKGLYFWGGGGRGQNLDS
jgi:cell division protein ZapE